MIILENNDVHTNDFLLEVSDTDVNWRYCRWQRPVPFWLTLEIHATSAESVGSHLKALNPGDIDHLTTARKVAFVKGKADWKHFNLNI